MPRSLEQMRAVPYDLTIEKGSLSSDAGLPSPLSPIDPIAEKKLKWKLDRNIIPILSILFMLAFIDRINIGNAKIQGLEADLGMTGDDYNLALFVFFIPYILFEVPSNLILKKVAPSTWLCGLMFAWGLVTIGMGFVTNLAGLVACRFLLGVCEAGFVPGCFYLISMYYKRYEIQKRFNVFFAGSVLAGAWAGLFAAALGNLAGVQGLNGWQWIFIVEGAITVVVAAIGKFFVVDWPDQAKFLTEDERILLKRRLLADTGSAQMNRLDKAAARRIVFDWKIYLGTFSYMGIVNIGYATSFFAPSILNGLGWTATRAQVMLIPIYVAATVTSLVAAYLTDKLKHRYTFTMIGLLICTAGVGILMAGEKVTVSVRYFALYLVVSGGYITQPILVAWLNNTMGGHYKRSVASAMQVGFGNIGGIVASNIFLPWEKPGYRTGFGVSLGMMWMTGLCCTIMVIGLWLENRKRDRGERDYRLQLPEKEVDNLGDDHPSFRFGY